tara:strand:- start:447 stop:590 length:144 start_codon:yes stop_codon:yes gene_type:complete
MTTYMCPHCNRRSDEKEECCGEDMLKEEEENLENDDYNLSQYEDDED